jgi:hypothetical protein
MTTPKGAPNMGAEMDYRDASITESTKLVLHYIGHRLKEKEGPAAVLRIMSLPSLQRDIILLHLAVLAFTEVPTPVPHGEQPTDLKLRSTLLEVVKNATDPPSDSTDGA